MDILNISKNTLGKELRLGFVNQLIELFSHVLYATKNNILFINIDSINWVLSWENKNTINHTEIFDIEYWNEHAEIYKFPTFIKYNKNIHNSITNNMIWQHGQFLNLNNEISIIFSKLIKPKKYILDIINNIKPHSYGTIHFRVEKDLKVVRGWYEHHRTRPTNLYSAIKNTIIDNIPDVVYTCVAIKDVIDENALEIFNNKISPWDNIPLVFGGMKICNEYDIPEEKYHLIGAIIDYFIAIDSTHFYIGPYDLSTFSRSISIIRKRNNLESYKITNKCNNISKI